MRSVRSCDAHGACSSRRRRMFHVQHRSASFVRKVVAVASAPTPARAQTVESGPRSASTTVPGCERDRAHGRPRPPRDAMQARRAWPAARGNGASHREPTQSHLTDPAGRPSRIRRAPVMGRRRRVTRRGAARGRHRANPSRAGGPRVLTPLGPRSWAMHPSRGRPARNAAGRWLSCGAMSRTGCRSPAVLDPQERNAGCTSSEPMARSLVLFVALTRQGCLATSLGLDREYPRGPRVLTAPNERPSPALGGCLTASFTPRCPPHPTVPPRWASRRDRLR